MSAVLPFHVDGYGFTTASCLKAYPELSCFEDLKSHIHGGFVTSKLETSIPCEKIPASNFNPWSNETTFYKANTLPSALGGPSQALVLN